MDLKELTRLALGVVRPFGPYCRRVEEHPKKSFDDFGLEFSVFLPFCL